MTLEDRFWSRVRKASLNECWGWKGTVMRNGYGSFKFHQQHWLAHRASWFIHNGKIPEGEFKGTMCVLHRCDNRQCANPEHLFIGTAKMNTDDMIRKGRMIIGNHRGTSNGNCTLNEEKIRAMRILGAIKVMTQKRIGHFFGITEEHAHAIINRKRWTHIK